MSNPRHRGRKVQTHCTETECLENAQVMTGRVHYSRISVDIAYQLTPTEPREVLANIASAVNPADALESYNPRHEGFRVLRAKLIELRSRQSKPIDLGGATLSLGMRDSRVVELRQR